GGTTRYDRMTWLRPAKWANPRSKVIICRFAARENAASQASFQTFGEKVNPCVYCRQNASTPGGSATNEIRGSLTRASYNCQARGSVTASSPNALGFVARRRNPCWVIRQK